MKKDVAIFYYGGTGGFFALHLLMLSGEFNCVWDSDLQDWETIYHRQWNIKNTGEWKNTETWVNNTLTQSSDFPRKVYFVVNPIPEDYCRYDATRVVVFTDADTQWANSMVKKCFLFTHQSVTEKANELFTLTYNNIRGTTWPDVASAADFSTLPEDIKDEILSVYNLSWMSSEHAIISHYKQTTFPVTMFDGIEIYADYKNLIDIGQADVNVTQQELVQTQGKCLYDALGLTWTDACREFTDHYLSAHPETLKTHLMKKLR